MFDWLGDILSGMGDALSVVFEGLGADIAVDIWNALVEWIYTTIFDAVLPAGSVANMYPLSFSGKTDPQGFYIGRDKYGTNILVDLDRRSNDKTNGSALILGNSGQGKSYLMKLLLTNFREAGKAVILLDVEAEYEDLTQNLGAGFTIWTTRTQ